MEISRLKTRVEPTPEKTLGLLQTKGHSGTSRSLCYLATILESKIIPTTISAAQGTSDVNKFLSPHHVDHSWTAVRSHCCVRTTLVMRVASLLGKVQLEDIFGKYEATSNKPKDSFLVGTKRGVSSFRPRHDLISLIIQLKGDIKFAPTVMDSKITCLRVATHNSYCLHKPSPYLQSHATWNKST